jgi:hypothetical protein
VARLRRAVEQPPDPVTAEWQPAPLGRLGRLLWADIDRYLEFVAIARSEPVQREATGREPGSVYTVRVTYLRFR